MSQISFLKKKKKERAKEKRRVNNERKVLLPLESLNMYNGTTLWWGGWDKSNFVKTGYDKEEETKVVVTINIKYKKVAFSCTSEEQESKL